MPENNQTMAAAPATPRLYNPTVCVILTLLFPPMFGGFLQGLNWKELGENELAARSMGWVRVSFFTFLGYTLLEPVIRDIPICRYLMIALFVGFWISWSLSLGIRQILYVRRNHIDYEGKFFGRAIMMGAFGWVAYVALALTLVLFRHLTGIEPLPDTALILQNP